ncbi:hypothetical protein HQ533_06255 [Candidatus Woesearchaeota archaeon]|nr:hypothetical protein [Candidatus Woesearchaeota archaeon]
MRFSKKAQAWSIDLVIGLMVFVLIMVVFYSLIGGEKESTVEDFANKADYVAAKLFGMGLVNEDLGEFNDTVFLELSAEDYQTLKEDLGIAGDFCVFVETNDDPPQVKVIVNELGVGWISLGSPDLNVSGYNCGQEWPPT